MALAEGGTLLLDEIGDLPAALQPKLLRFIEERTYERVGDPTPRRADVRILAATNRDLAVEARSGRFREDLYYRLAVLTLEVPPLRERRDDILPLAEEFVAFYRRAAGRSRLGLSAAARRALLAHGWPGNVRELLNAVERGVLLAAGDEIEVGDLGLSGGDAPGRRRTAGVAGGRRAGVAGRARGGAHPPRRGRLWFAQGGGDGPRHRRGHPLAPPQALRPLTGPPVHPAR